MSALSYLAQFVKEVNFVTQVWGSEREVLVSGAVNTVTDPASRQPFAVMLGLSLIIPSNDPLGATSFLNPGRCYAFNRIEIANNIVQLAGELEASTLLRNQRVAPDLFGNDSTRGIERAGLILGLRYLRDNMMQSAMKTCPIENLDVLGELYSAHKLRRLHRLAQLNSQLGRSTKDTSLPEVQPIPLCGNLPPVP